MSIIHKHKPSTARTETRLNGENRNTSLNGELRKRSTLVGFRRPPHARCGNVPFADDAECG
jgi:hypothetical protein